MLVSPEHIETIAFTEGNDPDQPGSHSVCSITTSTGSASLDVQDIQQTRAPRRGRPFGSGRGLRVTGTGKGCRTIPVLNDRPRSGQSKLRSPLSQDVCLVSKQVCGHLQRQCQPSAHLLTTAADWIDAVRCLAMDSAMVGAHEAAILSR